MSGAFAIDLQGTSGAIALTFPGAGPAPIELTQIYRGLQGVPGAQGLTGSQGLQGEPADSGQLALLAPLLSPEFTGTPLAPTPGPNINTDQVATAASLLARKTYLGPQSVAPVALVIDAGSVAVDALLSNNFTLTMTGPALLDNPTNLVAGTVYNVIIRQDATGSRLLTYGALYKFAGGTAPALSTDASAVDILCCYYDGTALLCALGKGYA